MEKFHADDGEILRLRVVGAGSPIVMLHGWTSSHTIWTPMLRTLASGHRVFCPDARGHGGHALTQRAPLPDIQRLARDVINLLDHYELQRVALVGHSMGALTAWQFIRDQGCRRLSHLCVIDQSPKLVTDQAWSHGIYSDFDEGHSRRLTAALETDFAEGVLRLAAHGCNKRAREGYEKNGKGWQRARESLRQLDPLPLIAIWKSLVAADYRDVLAQIDVPTLLAWGAESNFYSAETAKFLLQQIPTSHLSWYEEADHSPQLLQPDRFAAELVAFVDTPF
jgi:non-heme chloroperoxidase